ncbi:hypothetical protein QS257_07185 [Terrilactibacillus sp. S3-3]|nr:hypothetical protein QS257_07185 [Terrilactibacillus sp. S3-3]
MGKPRALESSIDEPAYKRRNLERPENHAGEGEAEKIPLPSAEDNHPPADRDAQPVNREEAPDSVRIEKQGRMEQK